MNSDLINQYVSQLVTMYTNSLNTIDSTGQAELINDYSNFITIQMDFINLNYSDISNQMLKKMINEFVVKTIGKSANEYRQNYVYFLQNGNVNTSNNIFNTTHKADNSENETVTEARNESIKNSESETNNRTRNESTAQESQNTNQVATGESTLNNVNATTINDVNFAFAFGEQGTTNNTALVPQNQFTNVNLNTLNSQMQMSLNNDSHSLNETDDITRNKTNSEDKTEKNNTSRSHSLNENRIEQDLLIQFKDGIGYGIFNEGLDIGDSITDRYRLQIFSPFTLSKGWFG